MQDYWFDKAPDPIPQESISEFVETDIVVVGCGLAGAAATLSAAETGARVVQLEKGETFNARGRGNFAFGCRLRPPLGDEVDNPTPEQVARRRNAIVKEIMEFGGYRGDQRIANFLVDHAGAAYDWVLDIAERKGVAVEARKAGATATDSGEYLESLNLSGNRQFHYDIIFQPNGQQTLVQMLVGEIEEQHNVDQRFCMGARQLVRDKSGHVCGVVAQAADGRYAQFDCKAVILATGGYEWDAEMVEKYGGMGLYVASISLESELNTGDGQKMGIWVGALMDEAPNCFLFEDAGGYHLYTPKHYGIGVCRKPWLAVNAFGARHDNEDKVWPMLGGSDLYKPGHIKFAVWDDAWRDEAKVERMGSAHSYYSEWHGYTPELTEEMIANGNILSDDTLDGLAGKMGIDPNILRETVDRYNWCCDQGYDFDFGKPSEFMKPVRKPPFYAAKMGAALLVTLGGLRINTRMEVLDTDYQVIPGLYAAGNVSGGLFFKDYPENIPGLTHSRAVTFGYHAAKNAYETWVNTH